LIKNPAVKEVENYAHALQTGFQLVKQQGFLSLNHIRTIQQRIINILYLILNQLLDLPALYLSRYITRNKADYYRLLQEVRDKNNWEAWVHYMLDAVEQTSEQTIALIIEIKTIMMDYKNRLKKTLPKIYSQDLLNNLFKHPYTKIGFISAFRE